MGMTLLPSQVQTINPILILAFIPLFSYVVYPLLNRLFKLTPLRKIAIGFFVTIPSFAIPAWLEWRIGQGEHPGVIWHFLAYMIITAAEILISITCLEYSYTQAPKRMKSLIMSIYLCSIAIGNLFTALVNRVIQNPDNTSKLPGAEYYLFFTGVIAATAVVFAFVAPLLGKKEIAEIPS
jgi:POT family proton-dependent oligopeptide transporter